MLADRDDNHAWPSKAGMARRNLSDRRRSTFKETINFLTVSQRSERRLSGDRRRNSFRDWPRIRLGGLPVVVVNRIDTARAMVDESLKRRELWRYPAYLTSTNGEVTYRCA